MDADILRKRIWEEMLLADMRANYFAELVRHYLQLDKALRVATLIVTSGAVATALYELDTVVKLGVPILAAAFSFWLLISQYGSMARDASDLHGGWSTIQSDYERIWNSLDSGNVEQKFQEIYGRAEGLSKSATKFPNKKRRLSYWLDHAATSAKARYA